MSVPPSLGESTWRKKLSHPFFKGLVQLAFAALVALLLSQVNLDYFEGFLYDARARLRPTPATSGNIELVVLDKESLRFLNGELKAETLVALLNKLNNSGARFIGLDLRFEEIKGSDSSKKHLNEIAAKMPSLYILSSELAINGDPLSLRLTAPYQDIQVASAPKTSDLKIFAKDNVTRRMLVDYENIPLFHAVVGATYNPSVRDPQNIHGQFDFSGTQQIYIDFRPAHTYPEHSLMEVLGPGFDVGRFKDKVVVVGIDTDQTSKDYVLTPYSREITAMTTTEMHANMFDTIILNSAPRHPPQWLNYLLILVISTLTVHVVLTLKPAQGLLILGSTVLGLGLVSYLAYWPFGVWLRIAHPLLAIFLSYYFIIPYRLIVENRRSWEYYQKNKLLSQVEELKSNFISMMSHDLKTPIARIQGMTDVISRDNSPLSSQQREALDTIKHSSDDLLKFINAILNYGRIESQGVQLHLQTKDVNTLLQEVVRKHEFLAKLKRIQIVSELEPLFPIPVDPELIKQVLSNLVENAIKYSPEDTKILISSEERDNRVVIQVADQGNGIPADELPNIFMKFFRSKNAKSSPIKGSGLGLYLAKYFTELHNGDLFVESSIGTGSTFTVELPMENGGLHNA